MSPRNRMATLVIGIIAAFALVYTCSCKNERRTYQHGTRVETNVETTKHAVHAKDFSLQTVVSLIKEEKIGSAAELEKVINDPSSGINNVNIDGDNQVDFIAIKENKTSGANISLDFMAIPSTTKNKDEAVTIASVNFNKTETGTTVSAGYPNYVGGYQDHYYGYQHRGGMSMGEAMFLMWMFSPRPMYMMTPYPGYYRSRAVMSPSMVRSTRTSYRNTTKVSPVRKTTRPKNYSIASAKKVPSRFKNKMVTKSNSNSFSSRKGATRKYNTRNRTRSSGSAFGGKKKKSSGSWFNRSRSRSRSSGSSWGGSSGSRRRSFGGGRSSFGGGRRRSDANFKTNIAVIQSALAKVHALRGVTYDWKDGSGHSIGVIAQEVKCVAPEAVTRDNRGYLVDYDMLIPILIEAIKELDQKCNR